MDYLSCRLFWALCSFVSTGRWNEHPRGTTTLAHRSHGGVFGLQRARNGCRGNLMADTGRHPADIQPTSSRHAVCKPANIVFDITGSRHAGRHAANVLHVNAGRHLADMPCKLCSLWSFPCREIFDSTWMDIEFPQQFSPTWLQNIHLFANKKQTKPN